MDSTDIVNSIFSSLIPQVQTFIQGDFLTAITGMIAIIFIVFAGTKIYEILHMSINEKEARGSFKSYMRDKGTWREPLSEKKYRDALSKYDEPEKDYKDYL